jgi:hypothetical protein
MTIWDTNLPAAATRVSWTLLALSVMFSSGLRLGYACGPKGCTVIYSTWGLEGDPIDCWMTPEGRTARAVLTAMLPSLPRSVRIRLWPA